MAAPRKPMISLADLNHMLSNASPEDRAEFAKNIPVTTARELTREEARAAVRRAAISKQTTEMAQMVVLQHGSAIHPPGFEPKPPEWVTEMGPEAKERWLDDWYAGRAGRTMESFRRETGDANAAIGEGIVASVEAATDNPEAVMVGGAGGDQHSYLSMATPAPDGN
jgi:broad specificity phosphatase PhoE